MPSQGKQKLAVGKQKLVGIIRPKAVEGVVVEGHPGQLRACAIPLLNATPSGDKHYTLRTITPPAEPAGAMVYAQGAPTCGEAVRK